MTELRSDLDDAWRNIWQVFGPNESWLEDTAKCREIQQRLAHFQKNHPAKAEHIDDVVKALAQGFNLVKSSVQWSDPAIGHPADSEPNVTHKARGAQWRLVMAYGGFETMVKTLLNFQKREGLNPQILAEFIQKCGLPDYHSMVPPDSTLVSLDKWLTKPAISDRKSALVDFLCLERADAKAVEEWMVQGLPISTWLAATRLAKALRNTSAHGALSASKINEWGMRHALFKLCDNLGEIMVAALRKLA